MSTSPNNKRVRNKLLMARQRAGYPQKWVAALLGSRSVASISRYERGSTVPPLRVAMKLALLYGMPLSELYPDISARASRELAAARDQHEPVKKHDAEAARARAYYSAQAPEAPTKGLRDEIDHVACQPSTLPTSSRLPLGQSISA